MQKGQKLINEKMENPRDGEHGGGGERSPRELLRMTMNIEAMPNQKPQWDFKFAPRRRDRTHLFSQSFSYFSCGT